MPARNKRALSPLVASVVLISAAILGGVLVYNYFQKSVTTVVGSSGTLQLSLDYDYLNATHLIVHLEALNSYQEPVTITKIVGVTSTGARIDIATGLNAQVEPGSKYSTVLVVKSDVKAIYVVYNIGDKTLESTPVTIG